jgi:hypothetical protein
MSECEVAKTEIWILTQSGFLLGGQLFRKRI